MKKRMLFDLLLFCVLSNLSVTQVQPGIRCEDKNSTFEIKGSQGLLFCKDSVYGFSGRLKTFSEEMTFTSEQTSDLLTFAGGQLDTGLGDIEITGTYAMMTGPDSSASGFTMSQSTLNLTQRSLDRGMNIGAGVTTTLAGSPTLKSPVVLSGATSTLNLNVTNKIAQNIVLNNGKVILNENTAFNDGSGFVGTGIVDVNNRTLYLSTGAIRASTIWFNRANDIQFTGDQTLNGATVTFTGTGSTSLVNGNGYTWNLVNNAKIRVDPNHQLFLTDIRIKGLGNTAADGIFDVDSTATLSLANVTLDQNTTYTSASGTISIDGDNCKVIPHGATFTVTGSNSRMIINGVSLLYEPLDFTDQSPFFFGNIGQNLVLNNNAVTRTAKGGGGAGGSGESAITIATSSYTLTGNQRLTTLAPITVTNAVPANPNPVTLDGAGYAITFPRTAGAYLVLGANTQLTITNCSLKDFNPAAVSYGDSNAKINFGDNTFVELGGNITLAGGDRALAATGNATISGNNHSITLNSANQLTVTGAKTFVCKNVNLYTKNVSSIACLTSTASLSLDNSMLVPDNNGLTISGGSLLFNGECKIKALHPTTAGQVVNFTFSSPSVAELCYVMSKSSLEIAPDTNFIYSGADKLRFKLQDPSSTLILNSCNFNTGTGLALNYGKLIVDNLVKVTASTTGGQEFELGSALDLSVMAAGMLSIDGGVKYTSTAYP